MEEVSRDHGHILYFSRFIYTSVVKMENVVSWGDADSLPNHAAYSYIK